MLFTQRVIECSNSIPEAIAITDGNTNISYFELHQRICTLAQFIKKNTSALLVGILIEKSIDYIISILAIHFSGRTAVPLDSGYPIEHFRKMISTIDLSLCLINRETDPVLGRMLEQHALIIDIEMIPPESDTTVISSQETVEDSAAYIVFTSGTTGQPKPVLIPYRSLNALVSWMAKPIRPIGTTLLYAAKGFDVSFQEIYSALCCGDRLLIISDLQKKDLHVLFERLSCEGVTRLFLPTSMLIPLVTFDLIQNTPLPALSQIIVAGEQLKITPAVRQWFKTHPHCQLINHYGPCETHVVMEFQLDNRPMDWPDLPPIGNVVPESSAYLLNEKLQAVEQGNSGELFIAGRSLALGYYNMPEQTAEKFVCHPITGETLYKTGDICVLNSQGLFEYKGRSDRQYKVRGYRVELKTIEAIVADSGLVDDCIVMAQQSGSMTSLILYFTLSQSTQEISLNLHTYLASRLPDYMLPSFYKKISAIPMTQNGKVDTKSLPQVSELRSQLPISYVPPRGEMESLVCAVTAACLGLDQVGAEDNFMDLGASSISMISLLAELRHGVAQHLRQTDLFEFPSPRQLCASLKKNKEVLSQDDVAIAGSNRKLRAAIISSVKSRKRGRYA